MNICSVCRRCYDDSAANCDAGDHGDLIKARRGDCLVVKGCKIVSRIESDLPVELYNAVHISSGKTVLIKFIEAGSAGISHADLRNEIQSVADINHPNLARVFEFGEINESEFYVVLEDVSGQNLRDYLKENSPLRENCSIKIARQIAEGLESLHDAGAIHRAVSPSNIYFANPGDSGFSVKLQNYDFGGIAQKIVSGGANGIDARTEILRYFSPEQFTAEKIDFKSDLYSLAVVFYEMLLGRSPYNSLNPQAISEYVFNERDTDKLHYDLRALIAYTLKQSLQHRTNLRPPTTNNLSRQLRHLELTAAPLFIGLPERAKKKQKQILNVSQTDKPKISVPGKKITHRRGVEGKVSEKKTIVPAVYSVREISAAEDILDLGNFETDLKESKAFEVPARKESEIVSAKFVENKEPAVRISSEVNKFDEQTSVHEFIKFDTTDLTEFESAFDNIFITNGNEDDKPAVSSYEVFQYKDPEFVQAQPKAEPPNKRQAANSFVSSAAPRSSAFKKSYIYIAGIIALFILSGFAAINLWQSRDDKNSTQTSSQKVIKSENTEKKDNIVSAPEPIKETARITEEPAAAPSQYEGRQSKEIFKTDETFAESRSNKIPQTQPALKVENKPAPSVKEKVAAVKNKSANEPTFKKREKTRTIDIRDIQTTTVIVVGRDKPIIKKADAPNKPRSANNASSEN